MFLRILKSKHCALPYLSHNTKTIEGWFINVKSKCCDQNKEGWILSRERQLLSMTLLVILSREFEYQPCVLDTLLGIMRYSALQDTNHQTRNKSQSHLTCIFFSS